MAFIQQTDGDFAGIERIYVKSEEYDLALIKVGTGVTASQISLSTVRPDPGSLLTASGFSGHIDGMPHPYSSESQLKAVNHLPLVRVKYKNGSIHNYQDLTEMKALDFPTCFGDSGGPVWSENTQFGLNTSVTTKNKSGDYSSCTAYSQATNVAQHIPWIEGMMDSHSGTSLGQQIRAFRGGVAATTLPRSVDISSGVSLSS